MRLLNGPVIAAGVDDKGTRFILEIAPNGALELRKFRQEDNRIICVSVESLICRGH